MGSISGDALGHAVPFLELAALGLGVTATLLAGLWGGFRWLRGVIKAEFQGLIAEWTAANERRHLEHERAIEELRERDNERAEAIKRLHGRVDSVWERVGGR